MAGIVGQPLAERRLQCARQLVYGEVGLAQDSPESSAINLPMIWNDGLSERLGSTHDHVTALLSAKREPESCGSSLIPRGAVRRNAPLAPAVHHP